MDPFGLVVLFFIERLSSLWRLKCNGIIEKGPQSVSFIYRGFFLYSQCPLSSTVQKFIFCSTSCISLIC